MISDKVRFGEDTFMKKWFEGKEVRRSDRKMFKDSKMPCGTFVLGLKFNFYVDPLVLHCLSC